MALEPRRRRGVYIIWVDGRAYVGSTVHLMGRICWHRRQLHWGVHPNEFLQRAFTIHWWKSFRVDIIQCDGYSEQELRYYELIQMDRLREDGVELFNIAEPDTAPMLGKCHTDEAKRKMRDAAEQYWRENPEARAKRSERMKGNEYMLGHKHSAETRKKMSKTRKGMVASEETKRKMSVSQKERRREEAQC